MHSVHVIPDDSRCIVRGLGVHEVHTGGSMWLKFQGRNGTEIHEELFHHVDSLGGYDMLFNKDFVNKLSGVKPPVLPIRRVEDRKKRKGW